MWVVKTALLCINLMHSAQTKINIWTWQTMTIQKQDLFYFSF